MAYPGDPSGPAAKGSGTYAGGRLSADDFDQLAAAFRPSWEFDEAPFVGAGTMSQADLHALQAGGGTHAEIRAVAQAAIAHAAIAQAPIAQAATVRAVLNGTHAPPKPAAPSNEPAASVIIDPSLTANFAPPAHPRAPSVAPVAAVQAPGSPDRLAQTRIIQRSVPPPVARVPVARESTGSFDARALGRSKKPMWVGLGVSALAVVAGGIWAASGSSATPPPVPVIVTKTVAAPDIPPPPPDTTPTPVVPLPKTVSVSALPQIPIAAPVVTAAPPAPARPTAAPATPAPTARPAVAPTPKPAARPKAGGGTIVHDVPF